MPDEKLGALLTNNRTNGVLAWLLVGVFALAAVESIATNDLLWAGFAILVGVTVLMPAVLMERPWAMPPWEVVLLAGLPVVARAIATLDITSTTATYLSIAALALLVAVNLHLFTSVEMNVWFAVVFVVVTTLAAAGLWALVRWGADLYLGTELLLVPGPDGEIDREAIEETLMWEFVASGIAGLIAGVFFEEYILRRSEPDPGLREESV